MNMDVINKIDQAFCSLKSAKGMQILNCAKQLYFLADRAGKEGITAYLRGVLTNDFSPEVSELLDANTLMLIKKHKLAVAYASFKLKGDLKEKMNEYIKRLKSDVTKRKVRV